MISNFELWEVRLSTLVWVRVRPLNLRVFEPEPEPEPEPRPVPALARWRLCGIFCQTSSDLYFWVFFKLRTDFPRIGLAETGLRLALLILLFKFWPKLRGLLSTEAAYLLLIHHPRVRFLAFPDLFWMLLSFIDVIAKNSGQRLGNMCQYVNIFFIWDGRKVSVG